MKRKIAILVLLIAFLFSACSGFSDELTFQDVWARPAKTGENGAVYFVIKNGTNVEDILLGASTNIAEATEMHMSVQSDQGVMSMQMQEAIQIPAREDVSFEPGGLHMMLVNLKRDLKVGDAFTLTLHFENAGETTLQVEVK